MISCCTVHWITNMTKQIQTKQQQNPVSDVHVSWPQQVSHSHTTWSAVQSSKIFSVVLALPVAATNQTVAFYSNFEGLNPKPHLTPCGNFTPFEYHVPMVNQRTYDERSISSEKSTEGIFVTRNPFAIRSFTSFKACIEKKVNLWPNLVARQRVPGPLLDVVLKIKKNEKRAVIKYLHMKGLSAQQIHLDMKEVLGDDICSFTSNSLQMDNRL